MLARQLLTVLASPSPPALRAVGTAMSAKESLFSGPRAPPRADFFLAESPVGAIATSCPGEVTKDDSQVGGSDSISSA